MSQYIYAVIPYKSGIRFAKDDDVKCIFCPSIPELKSINSELTDPDGLQLFADFVLVNTCYRVSAFANQKNGYSYLRAEIYKIAKALGAREVWYAEELATDEMESPDFHFNKWIERFQNENKKYIVELTTDVLKADLTYSYYHDDFSDIILENPNDRKKADVGICLILSKLQIISKSLTISVSNLLTR